LRGLLHPNPDARLTAAQALLHPFLSNEFVTVEPDAMPPDVGDDDLLGNTTMEWEKDDDNDSSGADEASSVMVK
jgi:serine/threonine protein kinase